MPLTEKQREYQRLYYHKNREKRLEASKKRGQLFKAEKQKYDRERRILRGDEIREYDRKRSKVYSSRVSQIVNRARARAKKLGIPFQLTTRDIVIPEFCPALGIRLEWHDKQGGHYASPSLDRIVPEKGYVPGNVWVISKRANCIKNDASLEEIEKVVMWLKSFQTGNQQE